MLGMEDREGGRLAGEGDVPVVPDAHEQSDVDQVCALRGSRGGVCSGYV
jgi:hypothetical protein